MPEATSVKKIPQKRLVLCFDGTGNVFTGTTGDTNIVKLFHKFDRDADDQYHYYQTGIGTYDINGGSINKGFFGSIKSYLTRTVDSGFGTSFDAHVMAGYRFVMQHYDSGDKIYMFGFSRGAYTARFLCRMINHVGLLSKGNDEMVPFVYKLYQGVEQDNQKDNKSKASTPGPSDNSLEDSELTRLISRPSNEQATAEEDVMPQDEQQLRRNELNAFRSTFCRRELVPPKPGETGPSYVGVKVYFLGLFDCVNSVAVLENKSPSQQPILGTAIHTRHAVAVDERRVKFKAALLAQETAVGGQSLKEVWFPGNHGDVGGGWTAYSAAERRHKPTFFENVKQLFSPTWIKPAPNSREADPYQMSDIPLSWMMNELDQVDSESSNRIKWNQARRAGFDYHFTQNKHQALTAPRHDTMCPYMGSSLFKVLLWNFMEYLPFFPRLELIQGGWNTERWRPNRGQTRDIPKDAILHDSLLARLDMGEPDMTLRGRLKHVEGQDFAQKKYQPQNNHGDDGRNTKTCLAGKNRNDFVLFEDDKSKNGHHKLYKFKS